MKKELPQVCSSDTPLIVIELGQIAAVRDLIEAGVIVFEKNAKGKLEIHINEAPETERARFLLKHNPSAIEGVKLTSGLRLVK